MASREVERSSSDQDFSDSAHRGRQDSLASPRFGALSSSKTRKQKGKGPNKDKQSSRKGSKLIFSVDDNIDDVPGKTEDLLESKPIDSDYLKGYNEAVKQWYQKQSKRSPASISNERENPRILSCNSSRMHSDGNIKRPKIEANIRNSIISAEENIRRLEELQNKDNGEEDKQDDEDVNEEDEDGDDNKSVKSSTSTSTFESLNLKDRQAAINTTHPFGIKIWKPSLYKKNRSVAARAQEDIHDYEYHTPTYRLHWGVGLCNMMWAMSFGLLLYIVCFMGAFTLLLFTCFGVNRHLRVYVKFLYRLGKFFLYPFGKFVLLNKDENYLLEDENEGRTITEYQRWRDEEEGRLFFAPPRRNTNANNENRYLFKDHLGRPINAAYDTFDNDGDGEETETNDTKKRFFGRGNWSFGRLLFFIYFYVILQPLAMLIGTICWLLVFTIPMSNLSAVLCDHIRRHPVALRFVKESDYYRSKNNNERAARMDEQLIVLCTYRSCGLHYYKYTIDGTNIFFINMLTAVFFVIFDYYALKVKFGIDLWFTNSTFIFGACLFSIIPLAYFIGHAVASISAQSSMGLGAVINAFFSTIVEVYLYCVALSQSKSKLVEGSLIGSILGGVLLLPGLSMCGGALKRKTQRYNPHSAGVSSTMLLFAAVVMFAPSMLYDLYGSYELVCKECSSDISSDSCSRCRFIQPRLELDELYLLVIKPFSLIVVLALFSAYACGLFFTLRTHASLIWATNSQEQALIAKKEDKLVSPSLNSMTAHENQSTTSLGLPPNASGTRRENNDLRQRKKVSGHGSPPNGTFNLPGALHPSEDSKNKEQDDDSSDSSSHVAPNWSRNKSTIILLTATLLYAVISEILVDTVDTVLSNYPINAKLLGLTIFALVPNTTEFVNAISFAIGGNVALSMEIGSAYVLQVVLIQIPCLVAFSIAMNFDKVSKMFTLVFPRWDIVATLTSIYIFIYVYAEGKSNYFKGVILMLIYLVVLVGFSFNEIVEHYLR